MHTLVFALFFYPDINWETWYESKVILHGGGGGGQFDLPFIFEPFAAVIASHMDCQDTFIKNISYVLIFGWERFMWAMLLWRMQH